MQTQSARKYVILWSNLVYTDSIVLNFSDYLGLKAWWFVLEHPVDTMFFESNTGDWNCVWMYSLRIHSLS
jgi:hypothetical protein